MTRVFNAPRRLVFEALSKPELVKQWLFGPPGWTMPVCEMDLRVGGAYRFLWRGPDGADANQEIHSPCTYPVPAAPFLLFPMHYSLPLCYNRRAVERAAKRELAQGQSELALASAQSAASLQSGQRPVVRAEDPSRYCPVCSQRLESRRCKLICSVCGYYMSCADYY